jgi:hypothetical protein
MLLKPTLYGPSFLKLDVSTISAEVDADALGAADDSTAVLDEAAGALEDAAGALEDAAGAPLEQPAISMLNAKTSTKTTNRLFFIIFLPPFF